MTVLLSYCGYRCDLCPSYTGNLGSDADRVRVSEDYLKYYGLEMAPEDIECGGCLGDRDVANAKCPVRPCAIARNVETCAECGDFVCENLRQVMDGIKPIVEKHGESMPPEDYDRYIRPFESEERLEDLRRPRGAG
jgi:hypothetical protein